MEWTPLAEGVRQCIENGLQVQTKGPIGRCVYKIGDEYAVEIEDVKTRHFGPGDAVFTFLRRDKSTI